MTHTVVRGDTLSALAHRYLGSPSRWPEIAAVNGLADPDLIVEGQVLRLPVGAEAADATASLEADEWGDSGGPLVCLFPRGWWVSSGYGWRSLAGYPDHHHDGVDYALGLGTPIRVGVAMVAEAARSYDGYGTTMTLREVGGLRLFLAHLDRVAINVGEAVAEGAIVAYSGNTGRYTSGAHLHLEVWRGSVQATHVNPAGYLRVGTV